MKKFGLIGDPIAHSLSPALFRAGYDGRYPYDLIEGGDFDDSFRRFMEEYDGVNVTAPFKELAFRRAGNCSAECGVIGAANILVKTPEGVKAYNSDFLGVRKWLEEVSGGRKMSVLIAGCGGAGKAAAFASASLGFNTLLMNRDRSKAEQIAAKAGYFPGSGFDVRDLDDFRICMIESDITIYNIPSPIPALSGLSADDFACRSGRRHILEANYRNPSFCGRLAQMMDAPGSRTTYTGGRKWLLYQALTGYEIFTGETPDLAKMSACL
ncbi:MAG: shikimate dehydrogenase family protein [Candidatus Cryptobacteroides sp.]